MNIACCILHTLSVVRTATDSRGFSVSAPCIAQHAAFHRQQFHWCLHTPSPCTHCLCQSSTSPSQTAACRCWLQRPGPGASSHSEIRRSSWSCHSCCQALQGMHCAPGVWTAFNCKMAPGLGAVLQAVTPKQQVQWLSRRLCPLNSDSLHSSAIPDLLEALRPSCTATAALQAEGSLSMGALLKLHSV